MILGYEHKEDCVVIKLTWKDKILDVLIDTEDLEKVLKIGSWYAIYDKTLKTPSYHIAHKSHSGNITKETIKLHRLITNCPKDKVVDHINHNTLDNRKSNLKICTVFENQQNLRSKKTEQTGIYYRQSHNHWVANITKNKERFTKYFKNKEDAIKWRKEMEQNLYKGVMQQCQM